VSDDDFVFDDSLFSKTSPVKESKPTSTKAEKTTSKPTKPRAQPTEKKEIVPKETKNKEIDEIKKRLITIEKMLEKPATNIDEIVLKAIQAFKNDELKPLIDEINALKLSGKEFDINDFSFSNILDYFIENAYTKYKNDWSYLRRVLRKNGSIPSMPEDLENFIFNSEKSKHELASDTTRIEFWFKVFKETLINAQKNKK